MATSDTRSALLSHAETLVRTRGYAAFSFADLAQHAAIRKPSVHHHFPTKEALGQELVQDYRRRFDHVLERIEAEHPTAEARLAAFAEVFAASAEAGMLPLCCALAAERSALPASIADEVQGFFRSHLDWLTRIVGLGLAAGEFVDEDDAGEIALLLLSTLEGGSLVGWALQDRASVLKGFDRVMRALRREARPS